MAMDREQIAVEIILLRQHVHPTRHQIEQETRLQHRTANPHPYQIANPPPYRTVNPRLHQPGNHQDFPPSPVVVMGEVVVQWEEEVVQWAAAAEEDANYLGDFITMQ